MLISKRIFTSWYSTSTKFLYFSVIGVSFFLRLYHIGSHDLWYDEVCSYFIADKSWQSGFPSLYYVILHYWIKLFGVSELVLRLPSLVFSVSSVVLVYILGKNLFNNEKVGLYSAIFMGFSPFQLWYAQEARSYSMVCFLGLLSSYVLYRVLVENKKGSVVIFILLSILGIYTNYFYVFLFLSQYGFSLWFKRMTGDFMKTTFVMTAILFFVFFSPGLIKDFFTILGGDLPWILEPNWSRIIITIENFMIGYNGNHILYFVSDILAAVFFLAAITSIRGRSFKISYFYCLFLFLGPILCAFFFSKAFSPVYLDRGLIIASPFFYLILAQGAASLPKIIKTGLVGMLISLFILTTYRYFNNFMPVSLIHHLGVTQKKPFKPAVKFIKSEIKSDDIIAFTHCSAISSFGFYYKKSPLFYFFDPDIKDTRDNKNQRPYSLMADYQVYIPLNKINSFKTKRIWIFFSDWLRSPSLDDANSQAVKKWCDKNIKLEFVRDFDGLLLYKYVPP